MSLPPSAAECTEVLKKLSIADLQILSRVARANRDLVREELRVRHIRVLQPFFPHSTTFLHAMDLHNGVVTGSTALAYLLGERDWKPRDLDVAVSYDGFQGLKQHLVAVEGYEIDALAEVRRRVARNKAKLSRRAAWLHLIVGEPNHPYDVTINSGIADVVTLRKDDKSIDLIRNASQCPTFVISRFWSTLQMNWFSATGFCTAYPSLTFKGVGVLNPAAVGDVTSPIPTIRAVIDKYKARGFTFHSSFEAYNPLLCVQGHDNALCPKVNRSFEDKFSMGGTFGTIDTPGRIDVRNKPTVGRTLCPYLALYHGSAGDENGI
ncbi:hypothetical protein EIP86_003478 [Pleurotus ostreatoroseus]|nr:hypothetical protein EIP86_003478 [Pleurotus ostreatoroseus]